DEVVNKLGPLDLTYPSDRDVVKENIEKRISNEADALQYEFRGITKTGRTVHVEVYGARMTYQGKTALIGTLLDITKRKISESMLLMLSEAVKQTTGSICITDSDAKIEYVNQRFEEITGYSAVEIIGENPSLLIPEKQTRESYESIWSTLKAGNPWSGELQHKRKSGEVYWVHASLSPVRNAEGEIVHFVCNEEDITALKKTEEELKEAKKKAEEMNRLKTVFLANMSHELRTPMIGILGYAESLYNELAGSDLKEMAGIILKSGNHLMETLNLILDLSRIEANKLDIILKEFNISNIVLDVVKLFTVAAKEKSLVLNTVIKDSKISALVDRRMFSQIIQNLVANAIKYTSKGEVNVEVNKAVIEINDFVELKVKDTGIGIPSESIPKIFEPFRQVSEGLNRSYQGTGLGLTITKRFVEMMNGKIMVESTFGKGSVFSVYLPAVKSGPKTEKKEKELRREYHPGRVIYVASEKKGSYSAPAPDLSKLPDILLVENDNPSIGIITLYLQNLCKVDVAKDGMTAVEMATEKYYKAILMDIDLGFGMNGLEAAKRIKSLPQYVNTPIIAVTAYALIGDKERFLAEGCTHYISKPFTKDELQNLVSQVLV
ncbi:MAG TPA: PAS domain S-box protein, partial [Ignavibacteriaceae bacterium]|nr:PAS domain S-box protein [Ignavibacteriaceae bacterium]